MHFSRSLAEVVSKAGVPYGYTLTVWSTGALCIGRFGLPSPADVFLFVSGGTLAYSTMALAVSGRRVVRATRPPAALWENVVAVPAIGLAYAVAILVDSATASFFLTPAVATGAYLLGLAVLVSRVAAREQRSGEHP